MIDTPCLSVNDVAKLLRVHRRKVRGWIDKGLLRAIDVGGGSRPQYRIASPDFETFVRSRSTLTSVKEIGRKIEQII